MVRGAELKLTAVELLADNGHLLLGDVNLALPPGFGMVWRAPMAVEKQHCSKR